MADNDFSLWLLTEMHKQDVTQADIARKGISHARVTQVLAGDIPGKKFCDAAARALKISREEVYRQAGWLPKLPDDSPNLHDCLHLFRQLSPDRQDIILTQMRALVERESKAE